MASQSKSNLIINERLDDEIQMIRRIKRRLKEFNIKEEEERAKKNGLEVQKNLKEMFYSVGRNLGRTSTTSLEKNAGKLPSLKTNGSNGMS